MKSFKKYVSKYLASFTGFALLLLLINTFIFGWAFYGIMIKDYGNHSPQNVLETIASSVSLNGISEKSSELLRDNHIWTIYLNMEGNVIWGLDVPEEIPEQFSIQDIAVIAKGYLADYPIFIRNTNDGMLLLGYPQDSYVKLLSNYLSMQSIKTVPIFVLMVLAADFIILFSIYYFSKQKILRNTEPIIASIETLGGGKPTFLSVYGELSEIANSVNKASHILSRQNQARANWISGVSHDIRTPLSMIMGYAEQIEHVKNIDIHIRREAEIIRQQSVKIKELVQDLNLVSQLEYEMQPIHKNAVRLSSLLRSYAAELLNMGFPNGYSIKLDITPVAETVFFNCDSRLISRAVNNLVQNSIQHNPMGCDIILSLDYTTDIISMSVSDNGIGLSTEKLKELKEKPHYMESTDDRLDLRHGLGLILVRQIVEAHKGNMQINSEAQKGYKVTMIFPQTE